METYYSTLKEFTDEWYNNNNAFPTIFEIEEATGCNKNVLQENLNFVPKIILDIKTELTHFFNSSYNIHFSVVSADETTKVYPAYKGICLHLIGKAEGEAINIKIMPSGKSLMIKIDAVNLAEINPLLKKPFKKFIKKKCQLLSDENTEVVFGYSTTLSYSSNERHTNTILPYYRLRKYFHEFDTKNIMENMEDVVSFILRTKKLYNYLQMLSGNAAVKANTLQKTMDEVLLKTFEDDSKLVIIAETILKAFNEDSMRLELIDNDNIHMELVKGSVEIFLYDDACHILADMGAIDQRDRGELIRGELQPFFDLDSGKDGYLYVEDTNGHLRYSLMLDYKKTSSKKLSKLIKKRLSFAMQLKQKYQDYLELVYGDKE